MCYLNLEGRTMQNELRQIHIMLMSEGTLYLAYYYCVP